jgi:hypothetical protein
MATAIALPGASGNLIDLTGTAVLKYLGFSVRETAGSIAVMRIREGGVTGKILETISLVANESSGDWYGPQGVNCDSDILYYQLVSGAIEGSIRYA